MKTVMVERSASYDKNKMFKKVTSWPKNRKRKIIHLSEALEIVLNNLKAHAFNDCDFIFQLNGRPLNYGTLSSSIRRSQARAGVMGRGTHIFKIGGSKTVRRYFGNLDSVIAYTGHQDPKMADHYSKLDSDDSKKVYSGVSDMVLNAKFKNNQPNEQSNVIRFGEHR